MSTPSDLTKSGTDLVLGLINVANPTTPVNGAISSANVTFSAPSPLTGDVSSKNASLLVSAIPGHGYTGTRTIKYNRLDIHQVLIAKGVTDLQVVNNSFSSSADLLSSLNASYGLNLSTNDIVVEALPADDPNNVAGNITYTLQAHPNSLAYFGTLPLTLILPTIPMARALKMNVLQGFVPPDTTLINLASALTGSVLDCFTVAMLTAPNS